MPKNVTYHNPIHQEENTPLVSIRETDVVKKQSTGVDARQTSYVIDLSKASFGGVMYPEPGTQWYIKKVSGVWVLMARGSMQNPQLDPSLSPSAGDTFIGNGGTLVFVDNVHATHNIVADGNVTLSDKTKQFIVGAPSASTASVAIERGASTDFTFSSYVTGDTQRRIRVMADGTHQWGSGSATPDTNLYRSAADTLKTDDSFVVGSILSVLGIHGPVDVQVFTSSGTWTRHANANSESRIWVRVQGAGGGGAGAAAASASQHTVGSGGGSGGFAEWWGNGTSTGTSQTVTVATGGAGGVGGNNGSNGSGNTSFGSLAVAGSGSGGFTAGSSTIAFGLPGGSAGTASAGTIQSTGESGSQSWGNGAFASPGRGGSSRFGGGGAVTLTSSGAAQQFAGGAGSKGSGGGGACAQNGGTAVNGGAGGDGYVIVVTFL